MPTRGIPTCGKTALPPIRRVSHKARWSGRGGVVRYVVTPLVGVRGWGIYGLTRVMLTINGDNHASVRVIEKNGGWLDWLRIEPETREMVSCYWIEL
jgi:hypothetical protein